LCIYIFFFFYRSECYTYAFILIMKEKLCKYTYRFSTIEHRKENNILNEYEIIYNDLLYHHIQSDSPNVYDHHHYISFDNNIIRIPIFKETYSKTAFFRMYHLSSRGVCSGAWYKLLFFKWKSHFFTVKYQVGNILKFLCSEVRSIT